MDIIEQKIFGFQWGAYGQPYWNDRDEVRESLLQLLRLKGNQVCDDTYNRVLYAIGNNHCGDLDGVAVPVTGFIIEIALKSVGSASYTAIEIMCEILNFTPKCEDDRAGIRSQVLSRATEILAISPDSSMPLATRKTLEDIAESIRLMTVGLTSR